MNARMWGWCGAWLSSIFCFQCGWNSLLAQEASPAVKPAAAAQPAAEPRKYIRIARDDKKAPKALETVILSFQPTDAAKKDVQVDLIGAVHVADKSYYEALNKRFDDYEVLLYELVAPKGVKVPKERPAGATSAVGSVQVGLKEVLALEFQLDCVDYTKANFVHADMSPDEFSKSMTDREESFSKMYFRAMGYGMSRPGGGGGAKAGDLSTLLGLFSKNRPHYLKLMMAEQFDDMEGQVGALEGPEGSTILSERNRKALEVLEEQLKAGKKKLGIFYGAAHLPDMEKRLVESFGMQRCGESWLAAWNLEKPK